MATIKVEIRSREMIKPSSPTPLHLKTLPLSFLDQMAPSCHVSLVYFYPNNPIDDTRNGEIFSTFLKRSLSNTLVHFYPLAGRLEGNVSINCNDEGVEFSEAYVSTEILNVIENSNLLDELTIDLLPFGCRDRKRILLGVQVNHFSCGGIALGVCLSHKISDGKSLYDFVNAWATITRAIVNENNNIDEIIKRPKFNGSIYFPPRHFEGFPQGLFDKDDNKLVRKRFVFDKNTIEVLKNNIIKEQNIDGSSSSFSPTRVEAVTAFIWKRVMDSSRAKLDANDAEISAANHAVNIRTRMTPSIPEDCFGNFWLTANTPPLKREEDSKHSKLTLLLREAIKRIDNQFIETLQNGEFFMSLSKAVKTNILSEWLRERCVFSSHYRFPIYEADFGCGKPMWVCPSILPLMNQVILMPTSCGQGIEAWVHLATEHDFALLQHDHNLISLPQIATQQL